MRPVLLYDADCGFCTLAAGWAHRLGLALDTTAQQCVDLPGLGVDTVRAATDVPFVGADGVVTYGHQAIAAALTTGPLPARLLGAAVGSRLLDALARRTYAFVARNRHRLPGGTKTCELPQN